MNGRMILIADGEPNVHTMMNQALTPLKVQVLHAMNGEDALRRIAEKPDGDEIAVVFLGLKLPGMDGLAVLRQIRREWPDVRVVIVSAHGSVETVAEAMKLGAADFLEKPFTPREVLDLAAQLLERRVLEATVNIDFSEWADFMCQSVSTRSEACAQEIVRLAMSTGTGRGDAYTLLAALFENGFRRLAEIREMPVSFPSPEPFIEGQ
jgi:Response regulator containing CheY-like receiver, AAA-type ATPase, and DNA-binding domains